jgi:hypothetical protein
MFKFIIFKNNNLKYHYYYIMDYYNIFGEFIRNSNIESFTDVAIQEEEKKSFLIRLLDFEKKVKTGKLNQEMIRFKLDRFNKNKDKMNSKETKLLEKITKQNIQKIDGINLVGNLELGGIVKAHGFYLTDGKKMKEIQRIKKESVLPFDKNGNMKLECKKKTNKIIAKNEVQIVNDKVKGNNPTGLDTHFNYKGKALNYIRGKTEIRGELNHVDKSKGINISNPRNGNNPSGGGTHFNYRGKGLNYIRGKTEMRGEVNHVDKSKGINISNPKNSNNRSGGGTHFNYRGRGLNYLRGKTEMRGEVNYVDKSKGINISNPRNSNNRSGGGTHFNYRGKGLNYLRGKTEMRGEVNYVDKSKGINISNPRNSNNSSGGGTHFNYRGRGLNYIRGKTEMRGEVNYVDKSKGINIYNPRNSNNRSGGGTHFNYRGSGKNYIRGTTEIRGNTSIQSGRLCIGSTCLSESQLRRLKSRLNL